MGCDMLVALGRATVDGQALFGHNCNRPVREAPTWRCSPGREFAAGEFVYTQFLQLQQARRTHTVLGCQTPGDWGYAHGLNDAGVAIGCGTQRTRLAGSSPGLSGSELVRLALERCGKAHLAVDLIVDLVRRHGQASDEPGLDHAFMIADAHEAFVVETCGNYWVVQDERQVRALSEHCTVRQDWDRIATGLASHSIDQGWWPGDGSKLDFAEALASVSPLDANSSHRRWGRATLLLEQQNGHLDSACFRRILSDHYEGCADEVDPCQPTGKRI